MPFDSLYVTLHTLHRSTLPGLHFLQLGLAAAQLLRVPSSRPSRVALNRRHTVVWRNSWPGRSTLEGNVGWLMASGNIVCSRGKEGRQQLRAGSSHRLFAPRGQLRRQRRAPRMDARMPAAGMLLVAASPEVGGHHAQLAPSVGTQQRTVSSATAAHFWYFTPSLPLHLPEKALPVLTHTAAQSASCACLPVPWGRWPLCPRLASGGAGTMGDAGMRRCCPALLPRCCRLCCTQQDRGQVKERTGVQHKSRGGGQEVQPAARAWVHQGGGIVGPA